jgi:hypothetical protein
VNYWIGDLPTSPLGGTHLVLSFLESATPTIPKDGDNSWVKYALAQFANLDEEKKTAWLSMMRESGTKVMASVGGALAAHDIYKTYDPTAFGARAAKYVVDLGLDGLDIDLEGWGNDAEGYAFLKSMTAGAFNHFAKSGRGKHYVLTHAPEVPDFWGGNLYMALMADRDAFDMIDFLNVQFYNQIPYPTKDHVFTKGIYSPLSKAPTSLAGICKAISEASKGKVSQDEASAKLHLGFPCKDGSFPVAGEDLNQCGSPQFALVKYGVSTLHYPLPGVFEWSARGLPSSAIVAWNSGMRNAMGVSLGNKSGYLVV